MSEIIFYFIILNTYIYSSYIGAHISFFISLLNNMGPEVQLDFLTYLSNASVSKSRCNQELTEGEAFLIHHILIGWETKCTSRLIIVIL